MAPLKSTPATKTWRSFANISEIMAKDKIYSAIDLGTQTIRAAIGRLSDDSSLEVIGYGTSQSNGIIKGRVEDIKAAQEAVSKAVLAAENDVKSRLDHRMMEVTTSVSGAVVSSETDATNMSNSLRSGEVTEKLLSELDAKLEELFTHKDLKPLHVYVTEYNVDNQRETGHENVLELKGERIAAQALGIVGDSRELDKIAEMLGNAGHRVDCFCFDAVADGLAVLTEDQRKIGALVVKSGAGSTDFAFWKNGVVQFIGTFPVGGDHVTNDLALGLNMPFGTAEDLKCSYDKNQSEVRVGGKLYKTRSVEQIIEARTEETVLLIADLIKRNGMLSQIQGGVFLTGNASRSSFINYMRREFSSLEVTAALPVIPSEKESCSGEEKGRLFSPYYGNKFQLDAGSATVLGMLKYAAQEDLNKSSKGSSGIFKFFNLL